MKVLLQTPWYLTFGWFIRIEWVPQDCWVGLHWKNTKDRIDIWLCLIPCFPIHYASPIDENNGGDKEEK